ncbi:ABC transporter permease [Kitasatospora viridis]|uniref:Putative ABC transport system permease protein n=1 Tax=Kitasatospora viridis TaxID=281105 RepID=A0A561UFR6_9ACTN|nr:ABC transporter permease [Kitasatospora viridis]TWF98211.1 putative ABC transport system permease protein [Kitasatospora viridis]
MFRTALRNVLAHKGRLLMTVLAVLLGTAFVAGTMVFSDTFGSALKNSYSKGYDHLSVRVTDNRSALAGITDEDPDPTAQHLTAGTVAQLGALPGVSQARGVVSGFTAIADKTGKSIGQGGGSAGGNFAPGPDGKDARYQLTQGHGPQNAGEIALDQGSADKAGYHLGDTVRFAVNGPAQDAKLAGIFSTDDPGVNSGNPLVLFDTATAQRLLAAPGQFNSIEVVGAPGSSQQQLQDEVLTVIPHSGNITAQTANQLQDDQRKMIEDGTSTMRTMLLAFAGISLFVGIFIIANTFTMLIAQRTRELALLRAIGAGRGQVTRSVLIEALAIGLVASVAGLLAGIGIGAGLQSLVGSLGNGSNPTGPLIVSPLTVLVSLATGVLVTVLSALLPAVRAARIAPVAAMSSSDQPASQKSLVVRNSIGGVLAAAGFGLILLGSSQGGSGKWTVAGGAVLALLGVFVLTPLLSRPLIALLGPVLGKLFGVAGKLARQNAVRNPRRTAATASALTIGLTLVTALTVLGTSVNAALDKAVGSSMKADYSVGLSNGLSVSPDLAARIAHAPGVAAATPVTSSYFKIGGDKQTVSGLDPAAASQVLDFPVTSGSAAALGQGQLLVSSELAKSDGLTVGSTVPAAFPNGTTANLTVGGVFDSVPRLHSMVLDNAVLTAHQVPSNTDSVLVKGAGGESSTLRQALVDAAGDNPLIKVQTKQDLKNEVSSFISIALNMLYGLLAMSVLVAVLGVINTMAMSVFERKREIGMLRAIGLDRRGIRRMVRLESVVISVFGAVLGLGLGCFLAWAVNGTLKDGLAGLTTVLPWGRLAIFLALAGLVGLVAAYWPSRRAAKLDILDSIKAG